MPRRVTDGSIKDALSGLLLNRYITRRCNGEKFIPALRSLTLTRILSRINNFGRYFMHWFKNLKINPHGVTTR